MDACSNFDFMGRSPASSDSNANTDYSNRPSIHSNDQTGSQPTLSGRNLVRVSVITPTTGLEERISEGSHYGVRQLSDQNNLRDLLTGGLLAQVRQELQYLNIIREWRLFQLKAVL